MKFTFNRISLFALLALGTLLAGGSATMEGFGEDVKSLGENIEESAEEAKN